MNQSDDLYRQLVDSVTDYAIFLLSPEGHIVSWNRGAEQIKGYTAEEVIGKHFSVFYEQQAVDRGWPQEELRRATRDGRLEDEGWRLRKDGSRFWANVVISLLRGPNGEVLGFSKVTRDLTERRRFQEALRNREDSLRALVEGVKDHAMFLVDASGGVQSWNYGAQRLLGCTSEEALKTNFASFYAVRLGSAEQLHAELVAAEISGISRQEVKLARRDGTAFWAAISWSALRDSAGRPNGFACVVHDLSESKRVEALEAEGKRLGEFIAMLSHELRNPLGPIANAMKIMKRLATNAQMAWCVEMVTRQVGHLSRLVDDLLDISRVTTGKIRMRTSALDLGALVSAAAEAVQDSVEQKRHRLSVCLPSEPVQVWGDSTRLTQVVTNLLNNAIKYTPSGGHIDLTLTLAPGLGVLRVADTGIGMDATLLQRAFDPFVQNETSLDRSNGGLGIGLTLVKRIVELHRGSVTASSAGNDQGTTVTVVLPLSDRPAPTPDAAGDQGALRRVLVIDAYAKAAEATAACLRLLGNEVQIANDCPQAVDVAAGWKPEVVFLDDETAGNEIETFLRALRSLPGLSNLRAVLVSPGVLPPDAPGLAYPELTALADKPLDLEQVAALLARWPTGAST